MTFTRGAGEHMSGEAPRPSSTGDMDRAVERVREGSVRLAALSLNSRIALADSLQDETLGFAEPAVAAACRVKGISPGDPLEGEEWATGPTNVVRHLRLLRNSLQALSIRGNTPVGPVRRAVDGRLTVQVFPTNAVDRMLAPGASVEVRLQEGATEESLEARRASFYRRSPREERVVLILGGGNLASLPSMDVLTKLFNEGKACILKMSPLNAYLGTYIEKAFSEAVRQNLLALVYGASEEGEYLCAHEGVDEIHLTGSDKTHDRIVWGQSRKTGEGRRHKGDPILKKKITSELGNVSPVIVVPGPYRIRELQSLAREIVGSTAMSASCMSNAARILVTPGKWKGRVPLVLNIEDTLARLPARLAYYPGAGECWYALTANRRRLRTFGEARHDRLPWALITWLDPESPDEPLFTEESFCPVLGETSVGSPDPLEFIERAVDFVNEKLWGTLSATLVVHPRSMKDPTIAEAVEKAIVRLRYGTVAVNGFPGISYALASPPWGGYPGSTLEDVQSGRGWVHNTSMLEDIEKVVFRKPLTNFPRMASIPGHRAFHTLMRRMTALEKDYSWSSVPGVALAALRG